MDGKTKVTFTLNIGVANADQKETFTLNDLGYDPKFDTDIDKFIEEQWEIWSNEYIDGGWKIE